MKRGREGKKARGKAEFLQSKNSNCSLLMAQDSLEKPSLPPSIPLSLKDTLDSKTCFKLICGAGNENLDEVEKLVALYSAAGCRFFDFAASEEVLKAAQRGLDFSIPKEEQKDYHFCVSIGTKGDAHFQKAVIDAQKCVGCGNCVDVCPQKAVKEIGNRKWEIAKSNCIGCLKCFEICGFGAIKIYSTLNNMANPSIPYSLLPISCIELHVSDEDSALEQWEELCSQDYAMMSICIGRKSFTDEKIAELLKKMVAQRPPYSVIIQADGNPMSGGEDDFKTTLPAVETGAFIKSLNLPVYVILSGGTNSKTSQLCKEKGLDIDGIAFGSYARKTVRKYIEREDFWTNNAIFEEAIEKIKSFVNLS